MQRPVRMTHQGHSGTTLSCGFTHAGVTIARSINIAVTDPVENSHARPLVTVVHARASARCMHRHRAGRRTPDVPAAGRGGCRPSPRSVTASHQLSADLATSCERSDPDRIPEAVLEMLNTVQNGAVRRFGCARGWFGTRVMAVPDLSPPIPGSRRYPAPDELARDNVPAGLLSQHAPGYKVFMKP